MKNLIKVVVVPVQKAPEVKEIPNTLKTMQDLVGGYIESTPVEGKVIIICNEEGKLIPLLPNRRLVYSNMHSETICGDFFITAINSKGDNISLTDEQCDRYLKMFANDVVKIV